MFQGISDSTKPAPSSPPSYKRLNLKPVTSILPWASTKATTSLASESAPAHQLPLLQSLLHELLLTFHVGFSKRYRCRNKGLGRRLVSRGQWFRTVFYGQGCSRLRGGLRVGGSSRSGPHAEVLQGRQIAVAEVLRRVQVAAVMFVFLAYGVIGANHRVRAIADECTELISTSSAKSLSLPLPSSVGTFAAVHNDHGDDAVKLALLVERRPCELKLLGRAISVEDVVGVVFLFIVAQLVNAVSS